MTAESQVRNEGAQWIRQRVFWSHAQADARDWAWSDAVINRASSAGYKILFTFWVNNGGNECTDYADASLESFASDLAYRYRNDDVAWQFGNEPENGCGYASTATKQDRAARGLHAGDPGVLVVGPGFRYNSASDYTWVSNFLGSLQTKACWPNCADRWAVHQYDDFRALGGTVAKRNHLRTRLAGFGRNEPIWISEIGITASPTDAWTCRSENHQKDAMGRLLAECHNGAIPVCIVYRGADDPGGPTFGLIRSTGVARPSLAKLGAAINGTFDAIPDPSIRWGRLGYPPRPNCPGWPY